MKFSTVDAFKNVKLPGALEMSPEQLKHLHLVLAKVVGDVFQFCGEHGIECAVAGGTALGAVRHGGFIPWDDDVDLIMPRKDYEEFVKIFEREKGDRYWLHRPAKTRNYGLALARVRLKGTTVRTREDLAINQAECGAFVDIFIIDNTFDNALLRILHGVGSLFLGFLYSCCKFFSERRLIRRLAEANRSYSMTFKLKMVIGFFASVLPLRAWIRLWDGWNGICRNGNSRYVTIPVGRKHFFGELAPRAEMVGTREVTFEGRKVKCPAGLENYMTRLYGPDYMTPPPEDKREKHVVFEPFSLTDGES